MLPFDEALEMAKAFCAAEPQAVLVGVESAEREWLQRARSGNDYLAPLLNECQAAWAIIRQWTGHDPAIAAREEYIARLERLVWDSIYMLAKGRAGPRGGAPPPGGAARVADDGAAVWATR